jgi:hypothetical protein
MAPSQQGGGHREPEAARTAAGGTGQAARQDEAVIDKHAASVGEGTVRELNAELAKLRK